ncbi:HAD-IA family hydrolase [Roseovarius salinarum]|uniref:HAD-IA family hydrolase n=1 Tax=Roseovarius salinarum TaxID=1981892 RepID=UPI000C34D413|nr:HAD-IA family hydrolase [Roseovarius salinarum]
MRTVVFDLDGTLADTSGDLIAAANACFRAMGEGDVLDVGRDACTAFRGGRAMLSAGLARLGRPEAEAAAAVEAWYPRLLRFYEAEIDVHTRFYPGALDAVGALRAAGYRVGICTNKPEALAALLLERLGARAAFAALVGADTLPVRKPDPAPLRETVRRLGGAMDRAVLVGDTVTDVDTARAAGAPSILVTFGPNGREVATLGAQALIGHFDELPGVIRQLIG